ncbi:hypothetical protein ACLB1R_00365 [Escherichia coli]
MVASEMVKSSELAQYSPSYMADEPSEDVQDQWFIGEAVGVSV